MHNQSETFLDPSTLFSTRRIASYSWGAAELVFGPDATQGEHFKKMLFARQFGFTAETRDEVLETICLVHEYRHFQQDFIFGVGAWDYLFRNAEAERTLGLIKQINGFNDVVDYDLARIRPIDITPMLHRDPQTELDDLRHEATRLNMPTELAGLFSIRRLLELDAAIYTYYTVTNMKWTKSAIAHLPHLKEFYSISQLPDEYTETLMFLAGELNYYFDDELEGEQRIEFVFSIVRLLVVLALSHPDPETMAQRNLSQHDCLPGVRLMRSARALSDAWGNAHPATPDFDRLLSSATGFDYPTLEEYAQGWDTYLNTFAKTDSFPEYSNVRAKIFSQRYLEYSDSKAIPNPSYLTAMSGEPLEFAAMYNLPLSTKNLDGSPSPMTLTNRSLANEDFNLDRTRHVNVWRLSDFYRGVNKKFACIFGDSGMCPVRQDVCKAGIERPAQIPDDPVCRINVTVRDPTPNSIKF